MQQLNLTLKNGQSVFSWCPNIEESALNQVEELAKLPFVEHIAIMPDSHKGELAPIGSVIATKNEILPFAVGTDCGCGMGAFKTNLNKHEFNDNNKKTVHHSIVRTIPFGFNHNSNKRQEEIELRFKDAIDDLREEYCDDLRDGNFPDLITREAIVSQLGTLGGGNHFIEIQYDTEDSIWIMVHSGSRNFGTKFYEYYDKIATELCQKWHSSSSVPFLPADSKEGKSYLAVMNVLLDFAYLNRQIMIEDVIKNMLHYFPHIKNAEMNFDGATKEFKYGKLINIHHNYASLESHMGKNLWIHRKGAVLARKGVLGIIPGSQSTNSFITIGNGNNLSLNSSSHGSGRKMGRKEFNVSQQHRVKEIELEMESKGIMYSKFQKSSRGRDEGMYDISESGDAYKDVISVMKEQEDLVTPLVKLSPLINWKG